MAIFICKLFIGFWPDGTYHPDTTGMNVSFVLLGLIKTHLVFPVPANLRPKRLMRNAERVTPNTEYSSYLSTLPLPENAEGLTQNAERKSPE
jgi:hypothetical protein